MMNMKIHQIKIDFNATENIRRFVYVYLIESENLYLIDSGVYGCQKQITEYLDKIGRKISEVKGIFITHAHPDHIGSAAWWQEHTDAVIYASEGEKCWIENIDIQFKERPIPNFYHLAGKSSKVNVVVKDGDEIHLDNGITVKVLRTAGHSCDEVSYLLDDSLFIGDSVPVKSDIPIFIDEQETRNTLNILKELKGINTYYPAWDMIYSKEMMNSRLDDAAELIDILKNAVLTFDDGTDLKSLTERVCEKLKMPMLKENPLFARTISCLREGVQ